MIIRKLDYEAYKGLKYQAEIVSDRYLSIEPAGEGFDIGWVMSDEPIRMSVNDAMLSDWLDHPTAYTYEQRHKYAAEGEFHRFGDAFQENVPDRTFLRKRLSEIQPHQSLQIAEIAFKYGSVEA